MNILFIGFRGAGKTGVGREVASRLGSDFFDTDEMIASRTGMSVRGIVERDGWEGFRKQESESILSIPESDCNVISLGGGAVMNEANVEVLRDRSIFIWLFADLDTTAKRLSSDGKTPSQRPPLTGTEDREDAGFYSLMKERTPVYRCLADLIIDTSDRTIDEIAGRVCAFIKELMMQKFFEKENGNAGEHNRRTL